MKIGIALPSIIPNVSGSLIREWTKLADEGPFSSLAVLDRVVYGSFDPLITLAMAAGATQRIRLMTTLLVAPLRNTGFLAKETASLDALSNGRLTLGLGVGNAGGNDDFRVASVSFHNRGKRFEQQLELLERLWAGQPMDEQIGSIGPPPVQPGGPEVLIGAFVPAGINRLERWGHGYLAGGNDPRRVNGLFRIAEEAWRRGDRPRKPRLVNILTYGLGPDAVSRAEEFLFDYYAFMGPDIHQLLLSSIPWSPEDVRAAIQAFEDIGTDELVLAPCIAEMDQFHRLLDCLP